MFFFIFTQTLFLAAALLAVLMSETARLAAGSRPGSGGARVRRGFSNAALLVFYGGFFLLLFLLPSPWSRRSSRPRGASSPATPISCCCRPVAWFPRTWLTPQYGKYELYNDPAANLPNLFRISCPSSATSCPFTPGGGDMPARHPLATALMVAGMALVARRGPEPGASSAARCPPSRSFPSEGSLALAILPYAAAGKSFQWNPWANSAGTAS